MLRSKTILSAAILVAGMALPSLISAQSKSNGEQPDSSQPGNQQPGEASDENSRPRGRLPNHFGKLGITDEQRERIYGIQADYDGRIDALLAQIEELVADRDNEIDTVLTDGQRARLRELRAEARNKRESADDQSQSQQPSDQQ
jgi:Spy/CpxP family protein refolding chaperone